MRAKFPADGSVREVVLRSRTAPPGIAHGHPWVWREAVAKGIEGARPGEVVQVLAGDGTPVGRGLVDPTSPIAVRLWTRGRSPLDAALWEKRARAAVALRARLFQGAHGGDTDAYRVVHGEGDRMPGFVVDRYGPVAVVRTDGDAAAARVLDFVSALAPSLGATSIVHRTSGKGEAPQLATLHGDPPPASIVVREHRMPFVVDLARGQKTGAFLDQRENRRRVREMAGGRRVLNLFSYAGGFSMAAALGGATHVTSVDIATAAHATAQASFRAAGLEPRAHAFVTADAFAFLDGARARRETWDLVVSDPPSFAPSEKAVPRALAAYRKLHAACAAVLAPGATFCAASCSSHVGAEAFLSTLDDAALGRDDLRLLAMHGAGPDHPTLPAFPEGRYLKFAVLG